MSYINDINDKISFLALKHSRSRTALLKKK